MALTIRLTGLGSGIDKDRPDYTVYTGEWETAYIGLAAVPTVADRERSDARSDRVATLDEAKAQFQKSWDAWRAWAKLEEVP
jgi:hypothetical protein